MYTGILIFFIICCGIALFPYVYYLIKISQLKKETFNVSFIYPPISVVVNSYKEDLQKRLLNLLETGYPKDKMHVYAVNDGGEEDIKIEEVEIITFKERIGKTASINYMLKHVDTEIVVFTDADVSDDYHTLENLIAPFSDENIGAVCADVVVLEKNTVSAGSEKAYRSVYGSMCEVDGDEVRNFNGQMLALRRSAVPQISEFGADDANVAVEAHKNGYTTKYASNAKVYEVQPSNVFAQFKQKIRRAKGLIISLSHDEKHCKTLFIRQWMLVLSPTLFVLSFIFGCFIFPPYSTLLFVAFVLACFCCYKSIIGSFVLNQIYLCFGLWFTKYSGKWDVVKKG